MYTYVIKSYQQKESSRELNTTMVSRKWPYWPFS